MLARMCPQKGRRSIAAAIRRPVEAVALVSSAALILVSAGCASKGYVRREMAAVRSEMSASNDAMRAEMADVRNSVDQAMTRADAASGLAGEAREMALGKYGYREIERYTVPFDFNQDDFESGSEVTLDEIASRMQAHPEYLVDVYGYTDARGSSRFNYDLGRRRAESVVRGLSERVPGSLHRYAAVSYGETQPAKQTAPMEARRVEISLIERTASTEQGDSISQSAQ